MKRLFVIGYVWPEPRSSAAGSRMMQLLHFFKEEGYAIIFGTTAQPTPNAEDLEGHGIQPLTIKLNDKSFDELLQKMQPEIVLFDRFMMEEQFGWRVSQVCPHAVQILDTEDLHFLRKARQEALKSGIELTPEMLQSDTSKREIASIYRCDLSLIISEVEMQFLRKDFAVPEDLLFFLPFMLKDLSEEKVRKLPAFKDRQHFVSIGNFRHEPNADALRFLKNEIWPLIRKQLPAAEIDVFGAYVTPAMLRLSDKKEGFFVRGQAESAFEELQKARVLLAPLRFGAGLKGKFIDAIQAGTPSVTTTIGSEGMKKDHFWAGSVVDNPKEFAVKAVVLYTDQVAWKSAQEIGFRMLEDYSEEVHKKRFRAKLMELFQNLKEHRSSNFTGAMLRHHFLSSTKHLSRYIEMKNKSRDESDKK